MGIGKRRKENKMLTPPPVVWLPNTIRHLVRITVMAFFSFGRLEPQESTRPRIVVQRIMDGRSFVISPSLPAYPYHKDHKDNKYNSFSRPRTIFFGVQNGESRVRTQDLENICTGLYNSRYKVINLVPTVIDLASNIPQDDQSLRDNDSTMITLFEKTFIKSHLPFETDADYARWKKHVLEGILKNVQKPTGRSHFGIRYSWDLTHIDHHVYIVPFWTLYTEWIPSALTDQNEIDDTVFIVPLSVQPSPFSDYKYITIPDLVTNEL